MNKILALAASANLFLSAAADDSVDAIISDWRSGNTNAYATVMNRRLVADDSDLGGLMMKYFWDRVFDWENEGYITRQTNTIARLINAAKDFRGSRFCAGRDLFVADLDEDMEWLATHVDTEEEKNEYRETIRIGKHYLYLEMYTDVLKALEADGGFRTPPTVWTEDPALYRVAESDTNLVVCVTNLWHLGALTNVANIAARRLGRNADDLAARLVAFDAASQYRDLEAALAHFARLDQGLSAQTNQTIKYLRENFLHDTAEMRRVNPQGYKQPKWPFYLMSGRRYPHVELLEALVNLPTGDEE